MTPTTPPKDERELLAHPPEGFENSSWHNDACDSLSVTDDTLRLPPAVAENITVRVWMTRSYQGQVAGYCHDFCGPDPCECPRYAVAVTWWGPWHKWQENNPGMDSRLAEFTTLIDNAGGIPGDDWGDGQWQTDDPREAVAKVVETLTLLRRYAAQAGLVRAPQG